MLGVGASAAEKVRVKGRLMCEGRRARTELESGARCGGEGVRREQRDVDTAVDALLIPGGAMCARVEPPRHWLRPPQRAAASAPQLLPRHASTRATRLRGPPSTWPPHRSSATWPPRHVASSHGAQRASAC